MARRSLPHLVLAALAVAALASCSDDEPEPVATGGGIELSSTTTEQPKITEPPDETTTSTTTTTTTEAATTTTSTTTTTTAPLPEVPTSEELLGALPGSEVLAAGEWNRNDGPTAATGTPTALCDGSAIATPLSPIVYEGAGDGGALARFERPDESSRVMVVVAPLADVEARMAEAQTELAACGGGAQPVLPLPWAPLGEASIAYARTEEGPVGDAGVPGGQQATWALVRVGGLVVGLNAQSFWAEGQELAPAPTEAELQAFLQTTVDAVAALSAG